MSFSLSIREQFRNCSLLSICAWCTVSIVVGWNDKVPVGPKYIKSNKSVHKTGSLFLFFILYNWCCALSKHQSQRFSQKITALSFKVKRFLFTIGQLNDKSFTDTSPTFVPLTHPFFSFPCGNVGQLNVLGQTHLQRQNR